MHSNETETLKLSQFLGSDKPTYMGDYNGDMLKINNEVASLRKADKDETQARKDADEALSIAIADKLKDPKGNDTQILNGKGVPITPIGVPVNPAENSVDALKPFTAGGAHNILRELNYIKRGRGIGRIPLINMNAELVGMAALLILSVQGDAGNVTASRVILIRGFYNGAEKQNPLNNMSIIASTDQGGLLDSFLPMSNFEINADGILTLAANSNMFDYAIITTKLDLLK